MERTVWHIAAYVGHMEVLHKLWDWENFTDPGGVKNKFLSENKTKVPTSTLQ